MSAMIKAIARQFDTRVPVSRTTLLVAALWAGTFATFIALGLSN